VRVGLADLDPRQRAHLLAIRQEGFTGVAGGLPAPATGSDPAPRPLPSDGGGLGGGGRRSRGPLSPLGAQEAERARADIAAEQARLAELANRGPLSRAAAQAQPDLLSATAAPALGPDAAVAAPATLDGVRSQAPPPTATPTLTPPTPADAGVSASASGTESFDVTHAADRAYNDPRPAEHNGEADFAPSVPPSPGGSATAEGLTPPAWERLALEGRAEAAAQQAEGRAVGQQLTAGVPLEDARPIARAEYTRVKAEVTAQGQTPAAADAGATRSDQAAYQAATSPQLGAAPAQAPDPVTPGTPAPTIAERPSPSPEASQAADVSAIQQRLAKNLPKNTIAGGANEIAALHDEVVSGKLPGHQKRAIRYAIVLPEEAQRLRQATNLDLRGFTHAIDSFAIHHVYGHHGELSAETERGQEPLSRDDFLKIPDIIAAPDSVTYAGKDSAGLDLIPL